MKKISANFPDTIVFFPVGQLLQKDPARRPSAAELLTHPWMTGGAAANEAPLEDVHANLRAFGRARRRLKVCECVYRGAWHGVAPVGCVYEREVALCRASVLLIRGHFLFSKLLKLQPLTLACANALSFMLFLSFS